MKKYILLCIALLTATIGVVQAGTLTILGIQIPISSNNAISLTSGGKVLSVDVNTLEKIVYGGAGRIEKIDNSVIGYDSRGRVSKIGTKTIEYDDDGRINKVGDTVIVYDSVNRVSKVGATKIKYNSIGQLDHFVDDLPDGLKLCVSISQ